jgi:phosphate/sulfate permease
VAFSAGAPGSIGRFAIEHVGSADLANYIGVDTMTINTTDISAVPETSTWVMMIIGFGLIGGAMRRKQQRPTVNYNLA